MGNRKKQDIGMYGSGLWIINPTYQLTKYLNATLLELLLLLKRGESGHFILNEGQL